MSVRAIEYMRGLLNGKHDCGSCGPCPYRGPTARSRLLLFGAPNVGKSLIFNRLTGAYAIVSNYPGTTVEVSRGRTTIGDVAVDVVDTPGTYSLSPLSDDERVARDVLLEERPDVVVHVVGARDLQRMLPMTLQLIEAGLPVVLDINIIDEAERAGLSVDVAALRRGLGIPVVATAAATGVGLDRLRAAIASPSQQPRPAVAYPDLVESAAQRIARQLSGEYGISRRAVALLLLQDDAGMRARVGERDPQAAEEIEAIVAEAESSCPQPLGFPIAVARQEAADEIASRAVRSIAKPLRPGFTETLGRLSMHPLAGIPILLAVVYLGLYLVVGKLGAGVAVDFLEGLFQQHLDPAITAVVGRLLPWPIVGKLFIGDYGVITLGLRYAFAIVLPLVTSFFLVFALLEDSGYLPRLAMMVDRVFKRIGLSGRAVIPLVLGLGCDTMATLVTRMLETRRERLIATFLLALAIPCSAQLGVILGMLAGHPAMLGIWAGVVAAVFLLSGFLAARLLPGAESRFYLEIPPLRVPSLRNVATKTWNRVRWYAAEVVPLFLLASVLLWIGEVTRLFGVVVMALRPAVHALGLPNAAAEAFLFGFFRRDYGAARLFDVHSSGAISGVPLLVAMVTITLFVPCIAQFMVMQKERGLRAALAVTGIVLPFAFGVGWLLNVVLIGLRVQL